MAVTPRQRQRQFTSNASSSPGPSIDSDGAPVVDPTKNVMDMVEAAVRRQDDLRNMESRHVREIMALRSELIALHGKCQEELAHQEANRIDAIRSVDVAAGARAAEVSAMQASTLASQVAAAAEAMRNQVAAAAAAAATALATALEPIQKSIDDLRKAQYEQQGQKFAQIEGRDVHQDSRSNIVAMIAIGVSVLFGIAGIVFAVLKAAG